ncbi:hypothetical protein [Kitasatospora kazusensis]|uniref:hypothetical protein n=1 Tax=Kitasatospora kazusensis TaxID=407974 RepID=UPI0031E2F6F2
MPDCRSAIEQLQRRLDQGRATLSTLEHGQLWCWHLELDGRPVASSARAYRRQRECQYNLARFLAGARSAASGGGA